MSKRDFERLLLEAVDEALSSLGESLKRTTYYQLEESFNVRKQEIPYKTETFVKAIEEIFGSDVNDLEISILQRLYKKVGGVFEGDKIKEFSFIEYVNRARGQLYEELVNSMQSGLAVFHFHNTEDLGSFKLIAANYAAAKIARMTAEKLLGKTIAEAYPSILETDVRTILADVIRSGKAKNLGEVHFGTEDIHDNYFSVAAFPLSSNCIGLVFKNVTKGKQTDKAVQKEGEQVQDAIAGMGEWRWEPDTQWRQVYSGHSRARERWIRKQITREPRRAEYLSLRGREFLEDGDLVRARELLIEAEEIYQEFNKVQEAFEDASLRVGTYIFEGKVNLQEYFHAVEEYFQRYADFYMHERFIENLAHCCQWKGHQHDEERKLDDARASYAEAEEIFLILKKRENALFNAAQLVLTYKSESNVEEYAKSAEKFFEEYKEFSGNKHYKEVRAYYYLYKADESKDPRKGIEFLGGAEKLFLEINKRQLAFDCACRRIDLYWLSISSEDEQAIKTCFVVTERFFEEYQDFSEVEEFRRRLAKYYLFQARALASQLKTSLT